MHILYSEAGASLIDLLLFVFSTEGEWPEDMGYYRLIVFTNESTTETLHNWLSHCLYYAVFEKVIVVVQER